jgi:fermentation-respiration switch protein FrsA (DUF1100 family)
VLTALLRLAGLLAVAWLVASALMFLMQERLLYLPSIGGRALVTTPAQIGLAWDEVEFTTADGVDLHGWFIPAEDNLGTIIIHHGNAGNISHRLDTLRIFNEVGLNSFIFDYRGYGRSDGRPTEQGTYLDAEAAWEYVTQTRGIPAGEVVLFGRSLGAAIAARQATRTPPGALILESAFTSVPALAAEIYPIFPVRTLARLDYDTQDYLAQLDPRVPVLVVHSPEDEIIPYSHGEALLAAAGERGTHLQLRGDHNTGFLHSGGLYRDGLGEFIQAHLPRAAATRQQARLAVHPPPH